MVRGGSLTIGFKVAFDRFGISGLVGIIVFIIVNSEELLGEFSGDICIFCREQCSIHGCLRVVFKWLYCVMMLFVVWLWNGA